MEIRTKKQDGFEALGRMGACIEFFSAYQDLDIERMLSLCDPEGVVEFVPLGQAFSGKISESGKVLWSALIDAFPDLDNTVREQSYDEASDSVTCRVVIFGTQAKEFAGIPSQGHGFDSEHIFIFRFNGEMKINHLSISWDHDKFVNALLRG